MHVVFSVNKILLILFVQFNSYFFIASSLEKQESNEEKEKFKCPNASNPYHTCVDYCKKRWITNTEKETPVEKVSYVDILTKKFLFICSVQCSYDEGP